MLAWVPRDSQGDSWAGCTKGFWCLEWEEGLRSLGGFLQERRHARRGRHGMCQTSLLGCLPGSVTWQKGPANGMWGNKSLELNREGGSAWTWNGGERAELKERNEEMGEWWMGERTLQRQKEIWCNFGWIGMLVLYQYVFCYLSLCASSGSWVCWAWHMQRDICCLFCPFSKTNNCSWELRLLWTQTLFSHSQIWSPLKLLKGSPRLPQALELAVSVYGFPLPHSILCYVQK